MTSVLDLDPVRRATGTVAALAPFGDQALQPELAGLPEQVRPNLTLLKVADKNPLRPPRQQPRQVGLAQVQRQLAQILAIECQDVKSVELHLIVMPARVQP